MGLDPADEGLAWARTTLCSHHNQATSSLHSRTNVMDLIVNGEPVTAKNLGHLGDWAVWVMSLLTLARGSGVVDPESARLTLLNRFDSAGGGTPRGVRVYAARATDFHVSPEPPINQYALALMGDDRIIVNPDREPVGFSVRTGPTNPSYPIGLGKVALLVVARTYSSGPGHNSRLDDVVKSVGLDRILPQPTQVPDLPPKAISMSAVSKLFTVVPFGADLSLMPKLIRGVTTAVAGEDVG